VNLSFQYGLSNPANLQVLIDQRVQHEAYTSKPLERKFQTLGTYSNHPEARNTIQPNRASHFIAYFTKNECPQQRFITQREKRWKENRRNMAMTLVNLHSAEIEKARKNSKKHSKKRVLKAIEMPVESMFIYNSFIYVK
jgi:hypothetical protein